METVELTEFTGIQTLKVIAEIKTSQEFVFNISGDLSIIDFPSASLNPSRISGLWNIGCSEIFVGKREFSYREHNFGFDNNWECFEFSNYRENQVRPNVTSSPNIICETQNNKFIQTVKLSEDIIAGNMFSVTAVIKLKDGGFLYFANKHCGHKPDFHLSSARTLELNI